MRKVIKEQTEFKFGDKVIVKYGFYRGLAGKVNNYWSFKSGFYNQNENKQYHLITDVGNMDIMVDSDQIELVGHK